MNCDKLGDDHVVLPLPLLQGLLPLDSGKLAGDIVAGVRLAALGIPEVMATRKSLRRPHVALRQKGAKAGVGYLTIEKKGVAPDPLIGGSSDAAGKVEIHEMAMKGGLMKMRPLETGLEPGKTFKLIPGGYCAP